MEAIKQTWNQYLAFYQRLTGSQRLTLTLGIALVIGGLGYWAFNRSSSAFVPASLGKNFSAEEFSTAQSALRERGLTNFKQNGNQLLVPRGQVDRYNAALLEGGGLPADWASELEKQFEKQGWFPSDRQSRLRREIALGKELRRIVRALPDVADAKVVWARTEAKRFSGRSGKVTATVNIKPKSGRELPSKLIHSLRLAVANMISGLSPDDVTIFNLQTGESFTADKDSPFDGRFLEWIKQHTRRYKEKVERQLSYIPDVLVTVDVQVENLKSHIEQMRTYDKKSATTVENSKTKTSERNDDPVRSQPGVQSNVARNLTTRPAGNKRLKTNETDKSSTTAPGFTATFKQYIAAMPKEVHVSVGIPETYFTKLGEQQGSGGGTSQSGGASRAKIIADVKRLVAHAVGADPAGNAVEVQPYVKIDRETPSLETPFMETATMFLSQWGGPLGLGMFALLALWMVKRSLPKLPTIEQQPLPIIKEQPSNVNAMVDDSEEPKERPISPRERLQTAVRDNPETTAAVLQNWLATAD